MERITYRNYDFAIITEEDDAYLKPWEDCDGHGPVRKSKAPHRSYTSDKRPSERPLNSPERGEYQYYYDWQQATKLAKKDEWNAPPYDAPLRIHRAVEADYDYLRRFINGDWTYVSLTVTLVIEGCPIDSTSIGGLETYKDYHKTWINELADILIEQYEHQQPQSMSQDLQDLEYYI